MVTAPGLFLIDTRAAIDNMLTVHISSRQSVTPETINKIKTLLFLTIHIGGPMLQHRIWNNAVISDGKLLNLDCELESEVYLRLILTFKKIFAMKFRVSQYFVILFLCSILCFVWLINKTFCYTMKKNHLLIKIFVIFYSSTLWETLCRQTCKFFFECDL